MTIDGPTLFECESIGDLKALGLKNPSKAKLLLRKLPIYRDEGVPATFVAHPGNV